MRSRSKLRKWMYLLGVLIVFYVYSISLHAEEYSGGAVKVIYDYIGHYALNYTGNTNHYDYWDSTGTNKLTSRNYKDRTDISTNNNSSATISKTDSQSKIKHAFLIWQSRSENAPTTAVRLIAPSNVWWNVIAEEVCQDTRKNANGEEYVGVYTMVADVTSIVCSAQGGYGTYTVANIPVWDGVQAGEVVCGGESVASWQLVVVEESPNFPLRTISLNTLSQYFFNINYTVNVNFADVSSPTGDISMQWYNLFVDVDSQYRLSGAISTDTSHWHDSSNYRFRTPTRGLYKNGVSFNSRDTGDVYKTGSAASGAIHGHLYDDLRNWNNLGTTGIIYLQEGTNRGICVTTLGVSIDVFAYDIVFDGNGANSGSMDNLTCIYGRGYKLPENQFIRPYWKLAGWNTKPDGSGTSYRDKQFIRNLTDTEDKVVLYAQWKPDAYTITLDNQYAVVHGTKAYYEWYSFGNYETEDCVDEIASIIVPVKKGYIFNGYYTEKDGQGIKYVDSNGKILSTPTTFTEDTTLYAYWTPIPYKITLDNQGADTAGTKEYYQKFNVGNYTTADCTTEITQIEMPVKGYNTFMGYYTGKNGNGIQCVDESGNILSTPTTFTEDTTLYAYWKPNVYTISLDAGSGISSTSWTLKYYEQYGVMNCLSDLPNGDGYYPTTQGFSYTGSPQTFIAPNDGVYELLVCGASTTGKRMKVSGEIELNKGEILYINVGGKGDGDIGGFNGGGEGAVIYNSQGSIVKVAGGSGATDIRRSGEDLSNRIIVAGGSGGKTTYTSKQGNTKVLESECISLNEMVVSASPGYLDETWDYQSILPGFTVSTPYTFKAYVTHNAIVGNVIESYLLIQDVYGQLQRNKATITYMYEESLGEGAYGCGGGYKGGRCYILDYYGNEAVSKTTYGIGYAGGVVNAEYKTDANSGNGFASITYDIYKEGTYTETTFITVPRKNGYVFGGYYTEENGNGIQYVDESGNILATPTTFTEDTTLYAHWIPNTPNTYRIEFIGNGADAGTTAAMICNFNQTYNLTANGFTREGYTFDGWSTSPNGSKAYEDRASITNLVSSDGGVMRLYARWKTGNASYIVRHYTESLTGEWELHSTDVKTGETGKEIKLNSLSKSISGFSYRYSQGKVNGIIKDKVAILADSSLVIDLYYDRYSYNVLITKTNGISEVYGAGSYKYGSTVKIDAELLFGYEFDKWSGAFNLTDKTYEFTMPDKTVSLYAYAKPKVFTIYLDNQGAEESGTLQYYQKYKTGNYKNSACTNSIWSINKPKRTGYIFGGYYTELNGNGVCQIGEDGWIEDISGTAFTEDTVLYAKWTPITYKIHFEGNGSDGGSMSDMVCTYDTQYQLSANQFVKDKYRFTGWNTKDDGTGLSYIDKSFIENLCDTQDDVITLYAQWTPDVYIIQFDANSGIGTMDDIICEFNKDYELTANQFTKVGYDFAGWGLIPDGDVALADKAVVNNLHSTTGIVTLYAQWKPAIVNYKVNHYTENLDAEWILESTEDLTGYTETVLVLADLAKTIEGFTYKHAKANGVVSEEATILGNGSLVIDLYYTRNSYTVTLDKDGGISSVSGAGTYKYGETVRINAVVSLGYAWNCWSGTLDSTDKAYEFSMPDENVVMKANTSSVIYEISLDNQNADSTGTEQFFEKYNVDNYADASCSTRIEVISKPEKTGYIFGGYYTEIDGNGTQHIDESGNILSTPTTFTEDTTLYAYWTPITYIIRFEGNGSDGGSMSDMVCKYDEEYQLNVNVFTKINYTYLGWNTEADGSGTSYADQASIKNLSSEQGGVITLYAQWKPNTYEVYFDANGGDGTMDSISLFYDMEQVLPENLFTKSNEYGSSKFMGWNTDATATAAIYEDEAEVMNIPGCENGSVTLYAIWDDCPWIIAEDLYYSLYEAQNGLITYDELMSQAVASDMEDGENLQPGIDEEKETSFTIIDYLPTDFTQFTASGSVTETYKVTDSAGNTFKKMITVHVVDTTPVKILPDGTTRFINEKYYYETYENGGLENNSIWKTDPEFAAVIQKAFENSRNNTPMMSFSFTYEEILEMKEFVRENGIGNSQNSDALQQFYDKFMVPNMVN